MSEFWIYPLGTALGSEAVDTAQLVAEYGPVRDGFLDRTGFTTVYRAASDEDSLSLALRAIAGTPDEEWHDGVDAIVAVGSTSSLVAPGNSHLLQSALGLSSNVLTLDLNDACTGFVRALHVIDALIAAGSVRRVLLVLSDTYSRLYTPSDLKVSPLFSDGASAMLISAAPLELSGTKGRHWTVLGTSFSSEGSGAPELCVSRNDGTAFPSGELTMNGAGVLNYVLRTLPATLSALEASTGRPRGEVDQWFVHQGSRTVVTAVEKKVQAEPGTLFRSESYGNTVGSSIPFQLFADDGPSTAGTIGMLAFGVGLTIGGVLVRQHED